MNPKIPLLKTTLKFLLKDVLIIKRNWIWYV